jgi:hypothetical protein
MVFAFAGDSTMTRSPLFFAIVIPKNEAAKKGLFGNFPKPCSVTILYFPFRGREFSTGGGWFSSADQWTPRILYAIRMNTSVDVRAPL